MKKAASVIKPAARTTQTATPKGWKPTLNAVLKAHNKAAASGGKTVSYATQQARRETLENGFKLLRQLGHKLPDARSFKGHNMTALVKAWEASGLSASTLQNRISVFRTFAEWIGKKGMIEGSEKYISDPAKLKRHLVTQTDKTWSGQNQTLADKLDPILKQDPYVALQLELQRAFGLRMKEAALLKPHMADKGHYITVNWGTKGGRDRVVPIENTTQRDILTRAKALLSRPEDSMTPKTYTFTQWRNHYYHLCQTHGISRKEGITSHGLRHERLNEIYEAKTGQKSPIKGGLHNHADKYLQDAARQEVAEIAGHSRSSIAGAYLGGK